MKDYGYSNVNQDLLDRKMRNMKRSYKTIKDNNKKSTTGRGRVSWQYYDIFEDIFANDLTINHRSTLQSVLNNNMSNPGSLNIPIIENEIENSDDPPIINADQVTNSRITPLSFTDSETVESADLRLPLSRPSLTISENTSCSSSSSSIVNNNNKSLYNLRRKQLDVEEKRIEAIKNPKEF